MFDSGPDNPRSNLQVLLGFLLGVVASLGCLFLTIFLAATLGSRPVWILPAFNAAALIAAGVVALRHVKESSYALGTVIALALALLLDAACGVALYK
jgi:Na+/melibiose symporter-like transporter